MGSRKDSSGSIRETKGLDGKIRYGAQVRVTGFKPVFRSFDTKAELAAWRAEKAAELRELRKHGKGSVRADAATATLQAINDAYLADPATIGLADFADRKRQLIWWSAEYGTVKALEFGVVHIQEAKGNLLTGKGRLGAGRSKHSAGEPRSKGTVVRYLAAQRAAWSWAQNAGYGLANKPWPKKVAPKEPKARVRFLSDAELLAVQREAAKDSTVMQHAITIAITTGGRATEQFDLTWKHVDLAQSTVRFLDTKNGDDRSVHLPPAAVAAFEALRPEDADPEAPVFLDPDDGEKLGTGRADTRWNRIREAAGLKNFRWHDLRHSCASFLAQSGATLLEIGTILGHKSPTVTWKYAHLIAGKATAGHAGMEAKLSASAAKAAAQLEEQT